MSVFANKSIKILEKASIFFIKQNALVDIAIAIYSGTLANLLISSSSNSHAIILNVFLLLLNIILKLFPCQGYLKLPCHDENDIKNIINTICHIINAKTAERIIFSLICIIIFLSSIFGGVYLIKLLYSDKLKSSEEFRRNQLVELVNDSLIIDKLDKISDAFDTLYVDMNITNNDISKQINKVDQHSMNEGPHNVK